MPRKKEISSPNVYEFWQQYDQFIRSLHLVKPQPKKVNYSRIMRRFLRKLVIVATGAFFTTLAFYFLMDPLKIYNPGLNGLLKKIAQYSPTAGSVGSLSYYSTYYTINLLINSFIVFALWFWDEGKLEIIGTAPFYVLFQMFWTLIFSVVGLEKIILDSNNWQRLQGLPWLAILPCYLVIAMVAAAVHAYGYSLIFRARAAAGGFETITIHLTTQKETGTFPWSRINKIFGYLVLFFLSGNDFIQENPEKLGDVFAYIQHLFRSERLWATWTYIYLSPRLLSEAYPREKIIFLRIYSPNEEKRTQTLRLLAEFSPTYYNVYQKETGENKTIYVTDCYLNGWEYFILQPKLRSTGKIYINDVHEKN